MLQSPRAPDGRRSTLHCRNMLHYRNTLPTKDALKASERHRLRGLGWAEVSFVWRRTIDVALLGRATIPRRYGLPRVLLLLSFAKRRWKRFDFGRGADAYKRDWLAESRTRSGVVAGNWKTVAGLRVIAGEVLPTRLSGLARKAKSSRL